MSGNSAILHNADMSDVSSTPLPAPPPPTTGAETVPASQPEGPAWSPGLAELGDAFVTHLPPHPLQDPHWVAISPQAVADLGLDPLWMQEEDALRLFSGNAVPHASRPWASVYSGHQFGVWAGQLGDGRALTLGAFRDASGALQEIQLKGSGLTPYSRHGDGRAVLRSSIREFIGSEAMHALGIPTTRALCLTGSSEPVYRETVETAAVVTRFAPSFIRFGHFEHFAARRQWTPLRQLADHVIHTWYPECLQETQPYAAFLRQVSLRTAEMIAQWQAVGFAHGVMNTDNMSILGLTLDYGPFQFLDAYDPGHICNHSDHAGRYAFDRQPDVAQWNLYALAQALLPLIEDGEAAKAAAEAFAPHFHATWQSHMTRKLGLQDDARARALLQDLLTLMRMSRVDYTRFWRTLARWVQGAVPQEQLEDHFTCRAEFREWLQKYQAHLSGEQGVLPQVGAVMLQANPAVVPRNYLCQNAIEAAEQGNSRLVQDLLEACTSPFDSRWDDTPCAALPPAWAAGLTLSCSS